MQVCPALHLAGRKVALANCAPLRSRAPLLPRRARPGGVWRAFLLRPLRVACLWEVLSVHGQLLPRAPTSFSRGDSAWSGTRLTEGDQRRLRGNFKAFCLGQSGVPVDESEDLQGFIQNILKTIGLSRATPPSKKNVSDATY